ncbi:hypothetical protein HYV10_00700 [Candidatus Dependentiae bacterium]|nr:hypothetical protein [Candidatus Dependentiae bacterium]
MENKFILSVYLILSIQMFSGHPLSPETNGSKKLFSGTIEFPTKVDLPLCLFYKGERLFTEKHGPMPWFEYSFYDVPETQTIYVIITSNLTHSTQVANTLATLKIPADTDYICYKLQAKRNVVEDEHTLLTWEIFDHKLIDNIIPLNSLIFLFNPNLITGLKIQSWRAENIFRVIPTILIKPNTNKEEIDRILNLAQLAALDIKAIHGQNQSNATTIISAPKSN